MFGVKLSNTEIEFHASHPKKTFLQQVKVFSYTQHFVDGNLAEKMGTCCLFRRAFEGCDVVIFLIESGNIMKVASETLTRLLEMHGASARKNLSKANKIRQLMKLPMVQAKVGAEQLASLEAELQNMEKKYKKKKSTERTADEEEEVHKDQQIINATSSCPDISPFL